MPEEMSIQTLLKTAYLMMKNTKMWHYCQAQKPANEWFIDSGATKHITFDGSIMIDFVKYEQPVKIY